MHRRRSRIEFALARAVVVPRHFVSRACRNRVVTNECRHEVRVSGRAAEHDLDHQADFNSTRVDHLLDVNEGRRFEPSRPL